MSRTIRWLMAGALVLGLACGTTTAFMTDSASNAENLFRVGSLNIGLDPTSAAFNVPALAPGQDVSAVLGVKNQGSLPCTFTVGAHKTAGYTTVYDALTCSVATADDNVVLYSGSLASLASRAAALGGGKTQPLKITVGLPGEVNSDLADKYVKVSFDVTAEQQH